MIKRSEWPLLTARCLLCGHLACRECRKVSVSIVAWCQRRSSCSTSFHSTRMERSIATRSWRCCARATPGTAGARTARRDAADRRPGAVRAGLHAILSVRLRAAAIRCRRLHAFSKPPLNRIACLRLLIEMVLNVVAIESIEPMGFVCLLFNDSK